MTSNIFFIVGAQRAGTTYLYNILDQHPQIFMAKPFKPEPKFFLNEQEYRKGSAYYFEKYFQGMKGAEIPGEKSTSYIESREAANKIKEMFPKASILISIRNPVLRAVSNYYFSFKNKLETRTIKEVFIEKKQEPKTNFATSVSPFNYLGRGEYLKYIKMYENVFGKEKTKTLIFKKIVGNPKEIQKIYDFVGANEEFTPSNIYEAVNSNDIVYDVEDEVVQYLKDYYKPHIEQLENHLNEDLSDWIS